MEPFNWPAARLRRLKPTFSTLVTLCKTQSFNLGGRMLVMGHGMMFVTMEDQNFVMSEAWSVPRSSKWRHTFIMAAPQDFLLCGKESTSSLETAKSLWRTLRKIVRAYKFCQLGRGRRNAIHGMKLGPTMVIW